MQHITHWSKILAATSLIAGLAACGGGGGGGSTLPHTPTPSPSTAPTTSPAVVFNDYTTFGYDNQHDVFNPNSTAITPASVPAIHLAWQAELGGSGGDFNTQTQPILATEIPGHAGVLFVGGASGNVYAFDALTGVSMWTTFVGQEATQTCGTGISDWGIGGTAAYDPATKSLYIVGNVNGDVPSVYPNNALFHLDGATGKILGQVNVTPSPLPGESNFAHTAVTLHNGTAYIGTGTNCDYSSWRGRVVSVNVPSMTIANTFFTVWDPNNTRGQGAQPWSGGGVWGWGGVTLDTNGNVLTGVGNTDNGQNNGTVQPPFVAAPLEYGGYGEALLELSPDLSTALASNHPIAPTIYGGASTDLDVQGTPIVFHQNGAGCSPVAAIQDKAGMLSIFNETTINSGPIAQYSMAPSDYSDSALGGPAYSPATGLLYANVSSSTAPSLFAPGLIAINAGCGTPSVTWRAAFGPDSTAAAIQRGMPAPSAGGILLAETAQGPASSSGSLWAINASTGSVLNGGVPLFQTSGNLRMAPTIDGNWIFVLDNNGNLYGLTIDPKYKAITAIRRAANSRQRIRWFTNTHHT